jgi:hypothetical protein
MLNNRNKGKETVGNKYVIKCLKELGVYNSYVKVVKKNYKNNLKTMKLHMFCANGMVSVDYAFTWSMYPAPGISWAEIDREVESRCRANKEEYEKGWIYKNS